MVLFCARQERAAQSGWRLGAQVLVTNQRPTHYEGVLVRCSRVEARTSIMFAGGCRWQSLAVQALSEDLVHHLGALGERGPDLVTIDRLGSGRAIVTD
jgi:hypothetical protein